MDQNPNKTKISFDLDEVLFVSPMTHKTEPPLKFPFNKIFKERLRLGTVDLIHELQKRGVDVWVYTSSFRSQAYIRSLFRCYHVDFQEIINGYRHLEEVQKTNKELRPQKLPNRYRIDLHIDDEDVIVQYGKIYGFRVLQIEAPDDEWAQKILNEIDKIQKAKEASSKNK